MHENTCSGSAVARKCSMASLCKIGGKATFAPRSPRLRKLRMGFAAGRSSNFFDSSRMAALNARWSLCCISTLDL